MDPAQIIQLVELFGPPLINLIEKLPIFGPKSGEKKKFTVVGAVTNAAAAANPGVVVDPAAVESAVQAKFDAMKTDGTLGAPVVTAQDELDALIQAEVQKQLAAIAEAAQQAQAAKAPHGVVFTGSGSTSVHG